ncbi:hypothetical protein SteCoe_8173 [Stentor coeruleus]|uniref:Uncharacterized protein n=1 Tax=Stentor coeruleus TaxID=5963 RepID=A0A1R2CKU0_9CILI|nr:hypothetical protein SteCoe_8173 [Stentor coeruleus]
MTARVEELLSQLEQIDYRNNASPRPPSPTKSDKQLKEQLSFKRSLTNLLASPTLQDSNLKTELQDLEVQLKVLAMQKKKEKLNSTKQCGKISAQAAEHQIELEKIEKQLASLEAKAENIEKLIKEKQDEKLETFKFALKPLEDTANTIFEEKEMLKKKNDELNSRMDELNSLRQTKTEELKALLSQRTEYTLNREKLQKHLAEIKEKDHCNYKEYVQELETKEILLAIKNRKSKHMMALKEIEKKLAEIEVKIEKSEEKNETLVRAESFIPITIEKEIEDMEAYLNTLCKDLNVSNLLNYTKDQMRKKGYQYEEIIIKTQMDLIEDKEMQMEETFRRQKEIMDSKILEMRRATEEQEVELYALISNELPNQQLELALQDMKKGLENMRKEADKVTRAYRAKINAINRWKAENRGKLLINEQQKCIEDGEVIKIFKRELQKNIPKLDQWKGIENVINKYLEKLIERGHNFQDLLDMENERIENQNKMKSALKELEATRSGLLTDRDSLHKEFLKIITLEKAALKKFENAKSEIDQERNKMIEKITDQNMNNNKSGLLQIQKSYGDKGIKKIREKETQTVKETQEKQREGIKKKLDGLSSDISHWESLITKADTTLNETLKPEICLIDQEVVRIQQELSVISQQLKILNDAEEEVAAKLEFLMESKKRDIHRTLHRTLEIHGGDVDTKKIHRLVLIRDKKEAAIKQLIQEKEKIEKEYLEKSKNTEIEELRVKGKLSQVQEILDGEKKLKKKSDTIMNTMSVPQNQVLNEELDENSLKEDSESSEDSPPGEEMNPRTNRTNRTEDLPLELEETKEEASKEDQETTEVESVTSEAGVNIDMEGLTPAEQEFFKTIIPLLQGVSVYKKLSQRNSLLVAEYDPLESDNPEQFGFGLRNIKLNKSLTKIEFRHLQRPGVENFILVESLLAPVIPKHISEMIKAQKKSWLSDSKDGTITPAINKKYKQMKTSGLWNYSDPAFKLKSKEANNYLLFITLEKGGRVEIVATGYSAFKQWVDGINALVKFHKQLGRLRHKIT